MTGIRVLDFSRVLAGPYCGMLLGDLGADVLKVESPAGDETRRWGPPFFGDTATYYFAANRNKRSIVLDLKRSGDQSVVRELLSMADVVLDNYTDDAARRLALDHETIAAANPSIVHLSISGFATNPDRRGYDLIMQALAGLMSITGDHDGPPSKVGIAITDVVAGLFSTIGVLSGLRRREACGRGVRVEVSLYDATTAILVNQAMDWLLCGTENGRMGNDHPNVTPYGGYNTGSGTIILAVGTDQQFQRLCVVLDAPEIAESERFASNSARIIHRQLLRQQLEARLQRRTAAEWKPLLDEYGVPSAIVRTVGEALNAEEARTIATVEHPRIGGIAQVLSPIRIDGEYLTPFLAPPDLGEHGAQVVGRRDGQSSD